MFRISRLDRSEFSPDLDALYAQVFAQRRNVPNMFGVMAHRPELRDCYSEGEIVEMLCAIGLFNCCNSSNSALRMKPSEGGCAMPFAEETAVR
jgi:hypothetical protein